MADLYFERFDQAYCCYGGADEVRAAKNPVVRYLFEEHPSGQADAVTQEPLARP